MAIILLKILTNIIFMRKFKKILVSLKTRIFKTHRVLRVDVPNTCHTRAEKNQIIKATISFLEHKILINN